MTEITYDLAYCYPHGCQLVLSGTGPIKYPVKLGAQPIMVTVGNKPVDYFLTSDENHTTVHADHKPGEQIVVILWTDKITLLYKYDVIFNDKLTEVAKMSCSALFNSECGRINATTIYLLFGPELSNDEYALIDCFRGQCYLKKDNYYIDKDVSFVLFPSIDIETSLIYRLSNLEFGKLMNPDVILKLNTGDYYLPAGNVLFLIEREGIPRYLCTSRLNSVIPKSDAQLLVGKTARISVSCESPSDNPQQIILNVDSSSYQTTPKLEIDFEGTYKLLDLQTGHRQYPFS